MALSFPPVLSTLDQECSPGPWENKSLPWDVESLLQQLHVTWKFKFTLGRGQSVACGARGVKVTTPLQPIEGQNGALLLLVLRGANPCLQLHPYKAKSQSMLGNQHVNFLQKNLSYKNMLGDSAPPPHTHTILPAVMENSPVIQFSFLPPTSRLPCSTHIITRFLPGTQAPA